MTARLTQHERDRLTAAADRAWPPARPMSDGERGRWRHAARFYSADDADLIARALEVDASRRPAPRTGVGS